jgi:tryptophan synthase alpha chain
VTVSDIPVGVGLGVRSRDRRRSQRLRRVIVGSALVSALKDGIPAVRSLTVELADGVRQRITA